VEVVKDGDRALRRALTFSDRERRSIARELNGVR
jgi:hypothetical protein